MVAMSLPGCAAWHKELLIHPQREFPSDWAAGIVTLCLLLPLFPKTKSLQIPGTSVNFGDVWNEGPECGTKLSPPFEEKSSGKLGCKLSIAAVEVLSTPEEFLCPSAGWHRGVFWPGLKDACAQN